MPMTKATMGIIKLAYKREKSVAEQGRSAEDRLIKQTRE
jgi:hypothetical protein